MTIVNVIYKRYSQHERKHFTQGKCTLCVVYSNYCEFNHIIHKYYPHHKMIMLCLFILEFSYPITHRNHLIRQPES